MYVRVACLEEKADACLQIPSDIHITFNPTTLLEVTFPQTNGKAITLHAGVQLPRNGYTIVLDAPFPC